MEWQIPGAMNVAGTSRRLARDRDSHYTRLRLTKQHVGHFVCDTVAEAVRNQEG
jgi:hypothetical protein